MAAPTVIVLNPADNVAIACRAVAAGERVEVGGHAIGVSTAVPRAHKIALRPIAVGEKVIRSGVPIGSATRPIAAGDHVHVHNLTSDYMPTYTFDGPLRFGEDAR